jgi:hypothetical protein
MSDYLSNLAARSLNATEVIQPRLRSLFEPSQIASVPTVGQSINIGLEEADRVFTPSKTDFELDFTRESSKSSLNNPKSDVPFPPSSREGTQNLKSVNELHQLPDSLTRMQVDRDRPLSPPSIPFTVQPADTRIEPPPTQPTVTPTTASSEIQAALPNRTPELQTSPQRELIIERIIERVASPDKPQAPTLLSPQSSPIQTTELLQTVSEPLSKTVPREPDPERPTLNPVVSRQTIDTGHSSLITSSPKRQSHLLESVVQRIVTERVVSPVEPLAKVTPHIQPSSSPTTIPSTSATVVVQPQVMPYVEPKASAPTQVTATPEPMPTIQVTIGRIEVRATPPPTPPSQRQRETLPRSAPPVMSLDEYLNQRAKGGGR